MIENYINNEFCNPFDEIPQNFFMKLEHCGRYLYALDVISNKDTVADISCATGYGSNLLAQKAKNVIGLDVNDNYLKEAKKNYHCNNLKFIKADLNNRLKLSKYNISTIVSFETIEHTSKPFEIIKQFYDILPLNGKLILSFPNSKNETLDENGHSLDPFHLSVIKYEEMICYLKNIGFKINCILGQSSVNQFISKLSEIEKNLDIDMESFCDYSVKNILKQSRLLAYPNNINVEGSYSFIFDLSKIS